MQPHYKNIRLCKCKPKQLILRMETFSILIFTTGQCRLMGRISLEQAQSVIKSLSFIYHTIITPLQQVSQTVVLQMPSKYVPINLYKLANDFKHDINIQFEPELFPSLSLHYWKPLHVNVFSTGKVIILGCNASNFVKTIYEWLDFELLLL